MEKRFPKYILLLIQISLFLSCAISCTHITYESQGYIPVYLTTRPNHRHKVEILDVKEFYLWGKIKPDDHVYLDEEFFDQGYLSISNFEVSQFQTFGQFMTAFFSLGFYIPISFRLKGKGARAGD